MKPILTLFRFKAVAATLAIALTAAGCKNLSTASDAPKRPIPLAPVGVASSGIGGPGGDSADTRNTGTIATGEGDQPYDSRSGTAPISAAPGSVRTAQGRY